MKVELIERADGKGNVQRMDYEATDQRFYYDEFNVNFRTGKPWKPSATHIIGSSFPESPFLSKWRAEKGWDESQRIFNQAAYVGSAVHSYLNDMIRLKKAIRTVDIDLEFSVVDALKVKRSLKGFLNWYNEYQPEMVWTEKAIMGGDWAGTGDYECKLNIDDYKEPYMIDFKTSRSIHETALIQVSAYARERDILKPAILQIGNSNKSRYTFKVVDNPEYYCAIFDSIKETFYLNTMKKGQYFCEPVEEAFPDEFKC